MAEFVHLERDTASGVAVITLDRPKVNAINEQMVAELDEIGVELAADPAVRSVVIWGGPRVFAAGADIDQFPAFGPDEARDFSSRLNATFLRLESLPQITIAAVTGYALGGGLELAMTADFRIAAADARLGQPEILLGIIPGGGGTQRLPRLVGPTMAKQMTYSGAQVGADEALANGLVSEVHPADEVHEAAVAMAVHYAAGPAALAAAKAAIDGGRHLPIADAVALEADRFADAFTTDDARIGVDSFLEHGPGKASFTGR